uniref:Uncharacterized protein n=1 Tax=Globodera rostochiensis TaxID=31243 RepID=A0A914I5R5_GLORO
MNTELRLALSDLGRGRNKLLQAVRNVSGARLLFVSRQLVIVAKCWGNPNITFDIGIEQDDPDIPYTFGQFETQLNAICSLISNLESAEAIHHVASYLDVTADLFIFTG